MTWIEVEARNGMPPLYELVLCRYPHSRLPFSGYRTKLGWFESRDDTMIDPPKYWTYINKKFYYKEKK